MAEAWKEIRVFISSTFRDMQAERDHLVRFVFPRLRETLAKRRIRLVDVDLRWGVTADQDAFDLCMREIKNCHPRFLCMLGGRFGWVPPPKTIDAAFLERVLAGASAAGALGGEERELLAWLYPERDAEGRFALRPKPRSTEEVQIWNERGQAAVRILQRADLPEAQASITASEVHFGALDRLAEATFRHFYFRDPAVTAAIPPPHAESYREPEGSFGERALQALKARIQDPRTRGRVLAAPDQVVEAPLPWCEYPCAWDAATARVTRLQAFGDRVYADLLASVDAQFGTAEAGALPEFEEERAAMEAFVESRVERYFVGSRQGVFDRLHEHAAGAGGTGILCLVGEPGSGKSALVGKFWRDYAPGGDLVIAHFVGASAASSNARQLLRRLCHELKRGAELPDEIPDDYDKLREAWPQFLEKAAAKKRVLLLIDAVNQLDPALQAQALRWLPESLPANTRAVLSVLEEPGKETPALQALRARRQPPDEVPLRALDQSDAQGIIQQYLERYRKELDEEQRRLLLEKPDADKPLYLLTALEELRTLGTYEEITLCVRGLPGQTVPLFRWILERLEGDDGFRDDEGRKVGEQLVRRYCAYLGVGRSGMSEAELAELVSPGPPQADHLGNVAALQRLLRPYLMQRGELLDFFHGQLKTAVLGRYLDEPEERLRAHREVAEYFRRRADPQGDATWSAQDARGLAELPHHLTEAEQWDAVYAVLTDLGFLEAKCTHVGAVKVGEGEEERTVYGGVYELQEDYRRALERFPADAAVDTA